jgi:glycosyltransferase involved in cell wall biosynthesis
VQQIDNIKILAVIVLYNTRLEESVTYRTLQVSLGLISSSASIGIVIYDNSPVCNAMEITLPSSVSYVHDAENGGVSKAYNHALDTARQGGYEWLLLLDQDSELPQDFIEKCLSDLRLHQGKRSLAAIVPTVYCGSKLISPCKAGLGGKVYPIVNSLQEPSCEITAINSGALVRVAFLDSIGGFNNEFWLDMLDHWLFRMIYCKKKSVVIGSNTVQHDLSIHNYSTLSLTRYKNIINAESLLNLTNRTTVHKSVYRLRLFIRAIKLEYVDKRTDLSALTLRYLFRGD